MPSGQAPATTYHILRLGGDSRGRSWRAGRGGQEIGRTVIMRGFPIRAGHQNSYQDIPVSVELPWRPGPIRWGPPPQVLRPSLLGTTSSCRNPASLLVTPSSYVQDF
jgi:hypothetical protein